MLVFTIGYAQLSAVQFLRLLDTNGINAICDVRSSPQSRSNPDFGQQKLKTLLNHHGIKYVPLCAELGARPADPKVYVDGCVSYKRLAETDYFERGIERVVSGAQRFNVALMCAERDPVTCHRSILVSRKLVERGVEVEHLWDDGRVERHEDALSRLAREFGYADRAIEHRRLVENATYDAQAKKLAYCDPRLRSESQSDFLARSA